MTEIEISYEYTFYFSGSDYAFSDEYKHSVSHMLALIRAPMYV